MSTAELKLVSFPTNNFLLIDTSLFADKFPKTSTAELKLVSLDTVNLLGTLTISSIVPNII